MNRRRVLAGAAKRPYSKGVSASGEILDDWDQIIINCKAGRAQDFYAITNYKPLDLGSEGVLDMEIIAFNTDVDFETGNTVNATFLGKQLMKTKYKYSDVSGETYWAEGYKVSRLNEYYNTVITPLVPKNVMKAIVAVAKESHRRYIKTNIVDHSYYYEVTEFPCKLWAPSYEEMRDGGNSSHYGVYENAKRYGERFPNDSSRSKKIVGESSASRWWSRSVQRPAGINTGETGYPFCVKTDGGFTSERYGSEENGVPLGFCI